MSQRGEARSGARTQEKRRREEVGSEREEPAKTRARLQALINGEYYDDTSGVKLEGARAAEARRKEIDYFRRMGVYTEVPLTEC